MEILQLKYFEDAVKYGSFTKVAEKYLVPPSSISHTISKLEKELGAQLFARTGNRIALNDYGRVFHERISKALQNIEDGRSLVQIMHTHTVPLTLRKCAYGIIPMLKEFKESQPDIRIFFPVEDIEQKGSFFIRISALPLPFAEEFNSVPLFTEDLVLAVPSCNPLATKKTLTYEDIKDTPVVWFSHDSENTKILEYYRSNGGSPNILIGCAKDSTVAEFVKNDFGIAFYPQITSPIGSYEGITTIPLEGFNCKRTIAASWPKEYSLTDASSAFIDFAKKYYRSKFG